MHQGSAITVALGRFDDLLARGLRSLVEEDPSLSLTVADVRAAELSPALHAHRPRVAILDLASLASPVEVRNLTIAHRATQLVLLADEPFRVRCAQLLAFGAAACLSKATEERDLRSAIHLASRGLQLTPRERLAPRQLAGALTQRESDVLAELQRGRSNAQIAADLHVSVETVRTHARHIYRKLGVSSRRELGAAHPPPPGVARAG